MNPHATPESEHNAVMRPPLPPLAMACAALAFAACGKSPPSNTSPPPPTPPALPTVPSPVAPVVDAAAVVPPPEIAVGAWAETAMYRFRVAAVRDCGRGPATQAATFAGEARRLGARVEISARTSEVSVSPRDLTIESGGVVFRGLLPAQAPKPPAGCAPLLAQPGLRRGETATGVVLFEVPADFTFAPGNVALAYRPTRWGGAAQVQVALPDCLPTCAPAAKAKRAP